MAPHIEEVVSTGDPPGWPAVFRYRVWFTGHRTGSGSWFARRAHAFLSRNSERSSSRYIEVPDKKGEKCSRTR